ncbi:hypothetical protein [Lysinibacillus sp. K60]|uniref:hypothetical protein n=1 Tax=Lysinibacillus sp. K60 TaxID=2720027 RepID=UPI001C8C396D|nr:hypothetical protein [Lysinibacillus sp. K60]MBX8946013.1 hypothetical protein [Lysinibacillus sp. K60]
MTEKVWVNGQCEFDFEYLLNLTNQEFVAAVSSNVDDEFTGEVKSIKVEEDSHFVRVYVVYRGFLGVFNYFKVDKSYAYTTLSKSDLNWALEVM